MSIRSGLAVAVAAVGILGAWLAIAPAAAQGACTGGGKISKQIAKPMSAAQDAMKARKWQEVLARTREAESTAGAKSQIDLYWMNEFRGYAYHKLRQYAEAARELEAALNSPCMPEAEEARALQEPRWPVHDAAQLPEGHRLRQSRAQGRPRSGHPGAGGAGLLPVRQQQGSRARHERTARQHGAAGTVPKEQQLLLVAGRLPEGRRQHLRQPRCSKSWCVNYPKPEYWQNLMVGAARRATPTTSRRSTSCASRST